MDELIADYDIQVVEPGCAPGTGRWGALVNLPRDISAVFPYLNAVLADAQYDHQNQVLIWAEAGQHYAFRPREIRVARVEDAAEAQNIVRRLVEKVNKVWQERETITPRFTERKLASVIDIFRLLPQTNCRQCGYLTCIAYAADLRKSKSRLERCLPLAQPEYDEKRQKISSLISTD